MSNAGSESQGPTFLKAVTALEKANAWIAARRYDLAERTLLDLLRSHPSNATAHAMLASIRIEQERLEEAEEEARSALSSDPTDDYCLMVAARVAVRRGRHRDGEQLYLQSLRNNPENPSALLGYASLMQKTGYFNKAQRLVEASLRIDPNSEAASALLAMIQAEQLKSGAIKHGVRSVGAAPESDFSHYSLAYAALQSYRPFLARRHAREALRLDPTDESTVKLYRLADYSCRWTYLPQYYFTMLLSRIPGGPYVIWAVVAAALVFGKEIPSLQPYLGMFAIGWIAFCIYTWIADPLTRAWIRLVPTR